MRAVFIIAAGIAALSLTACASTSGAVKPVKAIVKPNIDVRPVKPEGLTQQQRDIQFSDAKALMADKDYAGAYSAFQSLQWDKPEDTQVQQLMGDCALALSKFQTAAGHYAKAANSPQKHAGTTLANIALGTTEDVEVALNAALEINLTDIRLWNALGRYHDSAGRWIEAQETYIRALSSGADRAATVNNMGMSLMMQGRYVEARDKFDQAMSLKPGVQTFDNNRRLSFALERQYNRVTEGLTPELSATLYNDAGYIALQYGDKVLARTLFTRALDLSPVFLPEAEVNLKAIDTAP